MPPPTLLIPGSLITPDASTVSRFMNQPFESVIPIQFILTWFKRKMSEFGGRTPRSFIDRIAVIRSETSSGKSTTLPTFLLRILSSTLRKGKSIICCEPRIANAIMIGNEQKEASFNRDISEMIGISTGPFKSRIRRGLLYATTGTLLTMMRIWTDEQIIQAFKIIIIDEAHILSLDLEAVLAKLKQFYIRNLPKQDKELPFLILASATFEPIKYAKYFNVYYDELSDIDKDYVREFGAGNIMEVTGRAFPIATHWPEHGTNDYMKTSAEIAINFHKENLNDTRGKNDILIFVPGKQEGLNVMMHLNKANMAFRSKSSKIPPFIAIYIDSKAIASDNMDNQIRQMPFNKLTITSTEDPNVLLTPIRRIILSTTSMESGVTIDSLKMVEDCGYNRMSERYFPWGFSGLVTRCATQSMIWQRRGRAGRLFPGEFYPTYTENSYKELVNIQLPEIMVEGCGRLFLDVIATAPKLEMLDLLDQPPADNFHYSVDKAIKFGFINGCGSNADWQITEMGKIAAKFSRIEMFEAHILFMSYRWNIALIDMINIVAMIGKRKRDYMVIKKDTKYDGYRELVELSLSRNVLDFIRQEVKDINIISPLISCELIESSLALNGFIKKMSEFEKNRSEFIDWCEDNFIKYEGMIEIFIRREDIINDLVAAGFNPWKKQKRIQDAEIGELFNVICRIKQCLYSGLSDNILRFEKDEFWNKGKKIEIEYDYSGIDNPMLLVGAIRIMPIRGKNPKEAGPLSYKLVGYGISVLNGYIDYDDSLYSPRS